ELKNLRRGRIREYAEQFRVHYLPGKRPWGIPCHCAFPCATENELSGTDAAELLRNGCQLVCEGANMPCTPEAVDRFLAAGTLFGPGKAANAGGVAVSGLEISQNAMRLSWSREEVERRLREIMVRIHRICYETAEEYGMRGNLVAGANIVGFTKVADAMLAQGLI
ncbi:MAG: NADP-specific glutamate dehydrogenase, partial [Kiritimatiellia bacterium]